MRSRQVDSDPERGPALPTTLGGRRHTGTMHEGFDTPDEREESRLDLLKEAALQAEYATGEREDTEEQAKRNILLRVATIVVGFIVLFAGLAMMVLPGPGVVAILAGLGILSRELAWAERMIEYVKRRAKVEELKTQPAWVQAAM